MWDCGTRPPGKLVAAENGDLVAVFTYWPDQLHILIDFKTGQSWPKDWKRVVDDDARNMLSRLRQEHGELWLSFTYDGELSKPDWP